MDVNEDHVRTLLTMGFPFESEIRKALRFAKNDLNEAVSYLTNENQYLTGEVDVEMKDMPSTSRSSSTQPYGPDLPPSYEVAVKSQEDTIHQSNKDTDTDTGMDATDNCEFPVTNLYELEGRVFTEHWSIPYKREESLGKCLLAATRLAAEGLAESDDNCVRFLNNCMPECFHKLLNSGAVHRWGSDILEGVYNMLQLLIDLVATRLEYKPVPIKLLHTLAEALNPLADYHQRNKARQPDSAHWEEKLEGSVYGLSNSPHAKDAFGWLTNLINRFALKGGFVSVNKAIEEADVDAPSLAALLQPLGYCSEFLNAAVLKPLLAPAMQKSINFVKGLEDKDLKEKKVGSVSDLLASMKLLCLNLWEQEVAAVDELRLDVALKMLKCPHFNAKMNALKEVENLIYDATSTKSSRTAIPVAAIQEWLVNSKILSIALEGNIDQSQYCDKILAIVDFIGTNLTNDELSKIWMMRNGQPGLVVDNLHRIIAAAAVKFNAEQLEHLFICIQKSWTNENDRIRQKLLTLIGRIGKDGKVAKTTTRVCELLWDLAHLPALPTHLIGQALEEHLAIISDSYIVKETVKKQYVNKCIEDIKKGHWVLPALRQLHYITKNIAKNSLHKGDKGILMDLNRNHEILKLVTASLMKSHKLAISNMGDGQLGVDSYVDGRYTHSEYMTIHLKFLHFILQEGDLYLPVKHAKEIMNTLIINPEACDWDKEVGFDWFSKGLCDLDSDTQMHIFQKEILRIDPATLPMKGFDCFRCFFESVNVAEHRLKRAAGVVTVERTDLIGIDYLWDICLNTHSSDIADAAVDLLMSMVFVNLAGKLKKDLLSCHKRFTKECNDRLEAAVITMRGSTIAQCITNVTRVLTSATVPLVNNAPSPSKAAKLLNIERLLAVAGMYIATVEETHPYARTILPHGASYNGDPIKLNVMYEQSKFVVASHSNEPLGILRHKIATDLKCIVDQVQIVTQSEHVLGPSKDQKLLHQLDIENNAVLIVKVFTSSSVTGQSTPTKTEFTGGAAVSASPRASMELDAEKRLPGVVMAMTGRVFDMLYPLAEMDEPRITLGVRNLLKLIPTDPSVQDTLDLIRSKSPIPEINSKKNALPDDSNAGRLSPKASPRLSPRKSASNPMLFPPKTTSSREGLRLLFDAQAPDMSPFRVLYNLEVLSSKLMPVSRDLVTQQAAANFRDDFTNAGGLHLVINILQRDYIASDLDYQTRQGCYAICLQLARFLLCGERTVEESQPVRKRRSSMCANTSQSMSSNSDYMSTTATKAIQTMGVGEFKETVACLMRVTWAAAAGNLHLAGANGGGGGGGSGGGAMATALGHDTQNNSLAISRSRENSTGSTTSTASDSEAPVLHAGVCVQQKHLTSRDTYIAKEALEILIACLQLRSGLIASFYSLPFVTDFILEILVGATSEDIRYAAYEQLKRLASIELGDDADDGMSPMEFILQVLLKARLPFWVSSAITRGSSQRLLRQCTHYFDLLCDLMANMSVKQQAQFSLDPTAKLEDEVAWLVNFLPSDRTRQTDNLLLAGHLRLIQTLFSAEGVDKKEYGENLTALILNEFLFPASKLIHDGLENMPNDRVLSDYHPRCQGSDSRVQAYQLLVELADGCLVNQQNICRQLVEMHHQYNSECANEWEYMPPVDSRAPCGFVGLKNGGATCYMNSVLQQLYMQPGVTEYILGVEEESHDDKSVFYQVQNILAHLLESCMQYHVPETFWSVFKLWGRTVNIREQQDALDFFQAIIDQMDEHLKAIGRDQIFKRKYQGVYSDQKICKECPHRFEREEEFYSLNVTVKNATLQDSLDQFVKGELLEGDNAYFCEKCGEKRETIKRMCIKTLPPVLCIQLKRFGYDWETNKALKFNDFFKFPLVLDMEPYTVEGMAWREQHMDSQSEASSSEESPDVVLTPGSKGAMHINYELVGVVVHSGQANAGHYYSFIKDRRPSQQTHKQRHGGKWYKFNDTIVEEFELTDEAMEAECFGGNYKASPYDNATSGYMDERTRYWSGYLLFYERLEESRGPVAAKKSRVTHVRKSADDTPTIHRSSDSFVELTELVHKGEKRGLFSERMPASIQQTIRDENIRFMKDRNVFENDYFQFLLELVRMSSSQVRHPSSDDMAVNAMDLAVHFLFNTYLRVNSKLRTELDDWIEALESLLERSSRACQWLVDYFSMGAGKAYLKPFLLECPNKEIRVLFATILDRLLSSHLVHGGQTKAKSFNELVNLLLDMLDKDVPDNVKNSQQYFTLLYNYSRMGVVAIGHLLESNAFKRMTSFLLGRKVISQTPVQESYSRNWSSLQSREFSPLHSTMALLILHCDLTPYRSEDYTGHVIRTPQVVHVPTQQKMPYEMEHCVFGADSSRYIREVIYAVREITPQPFGILDTILYCSFANKQFSMEVLKQIMFQYTNAPSNEIKDVLSLLMDILLLVDPMQMLRHQSIIDGYVDENDFKFEGMLSVIHSNHATDSRRSYQCIKFLVTLSHRCAMAKDYLVQTPSKWQWAVNWLKKKMSDHAWTTQVPNTSNDDSTSRSFQRTISAQHTLAEATALLTEVEDARDLEVSDMETNGSATCGTGNVTKTVVDASIVRMTSRDDLDKVD